MDDGVHLADQFVQPFQDRLEVMVLWGCFLQLYPLFEFWGDKVEKHLGEVHWFINLIVGQALRQKAEQQQEDGGEGQEDGEREKEVEDGETLLEHLVKFTDSAFAFAFCLGMRVGSVYGGEGKHADAWIGMWTDEKVLKDKVLNILFAGQDTMACMLMFLVFMLVEHPTMLEQLRKEVLDMVRLVRRLTYEDIRGMKYMHAFINEVLRLYPPVYVFLLPVSSSRSF